MSANDAAKGGQPLEASTAGPAAKSAPSIGADLEHLPPLLTVGELASLLRKSPKAIYTMHERGLLPGAIRVRRQLLFSRSALVRWLDQNRVPSLEGVRR